TTYPPSVEPLEIEATAGEPVEFELRGDDRDGDALTFELLDEPAHGTLELEALPLVRYTPEEAFTGEVSFSYKASDGFYDAFPETVTIRVSAAEPETEERSEGVASDADGQSSGGGGATLWLPMLLVVGWWQRRRCAGGAICREA
ncbi:MAG: Ig-like domain-containing protein, partial [Pseudomonadota bacterium]